MVIFFIIYIILLIYVFVGLCFTMLLYAYLFENLHNQTNIWHYIFDAVKDIKHPLVIILIYPKIIYRLLSEKKNK